MPLNADAGAFLPSSAAMCASEPREYWEEATITAGTSFSTSREARFFAHPPSPDSPPNPVPSSSPIARKAPESMPGAAGGEGAGADTVSVGPSAVSDDFGLFSSDSSEVENLKVSEPPKNLACELTMALTFGDLLPARRFQGSR
jgi:hypothetical protein